LIIVLILLRLVTESMTLLVNALIRRSICAIGVIGLPCRHLFPGREKANCQQRPKTRYNLPARRYSTFLSTSICSAGIQMTTTSHPEFIATVKQLLCPPGEGVFTVHTASDKRKSLQSKIFGAAAVAGNQVRQSWEAGLSGDLPQAQCVIFGIASDCGGGIQRGANWGPLFLRETLLGMHPDLPAYDIGDARVIPHLLHDKYLNEETIKSCRRALYQDESVDFPVSPLSIAYDFALGFHRQFPTKSIFMIGGDHSVSYPMVRAYLEAKKAQGKRVALIHFDAHTDLLEERLGIDLCFGTWTKHIFPYLASPAHLIQIGIRASGRDRGHWEDKFAHTQIWSKEVIDRGASVIANEIAAKLGALDVEEIYISYDIDCLDQAFAGATGTPETGGMTVQQSLDIIQILCAQYKLTGADVVEIAPMVKAQNVQQAEPETTLASASALSNLMIRAMAAA
jgi:agmatinase